MSNIATVSQQTQSEPPLVSIIVRTKDRPRLLVLALGSIVEQTHPRVEVVVVNDGGVDVGDQIEPFRSQLEHLEHIHLEKNGGRSAAANLGLEIATGEYLAFLDDDDLLRPQHIEQLLGALEKNPSVEVAYASVQCIDATGALKRETFEQDYDPVTLLAGNYIPFHAILFHRSLVEKGVRLDEQLDLYEDWDFLLQLSRLSGFVHQEDLTALYRITEQTGFGIHADQVEAVSATRMVHAKWRKLWSTKQVDELMERVRNHDGLTIEQQKTIKQLEESAQHIKNLEDLKEQQLTHIHNLKGDKEKLLTHVDDLTHIGHSQENHLKDLSYVRTLQEQQIEKLAQDVAQREGTIIGLEQQAQAKEEELAQLQQSYQSLQQDNQRLPSSTSWRVTAGYRWIGNQLIRVRRLGGAVSQSAAHRGGWLGVIRHTLSIWRQVGVRGVVARAKHHFSTHPAQPGAWFEPQQPAAAEENLYHQWVRRYDTRSDKDRAAIQTEITKMESPPLISVLMPVYNPKKAWLVEALDSVVNQLYPHWQLCIADDSSTDPQVGETLRAYAATDSRIQLVFRETNGHISEASNSALELVEGDWLVLMDHDDLLAEDALYRLAVELERDPQLDILYSDEDKMDEQGNRFDPHFKPDWNPELLWSLNYVSHLGAYRTQLVRSVGGFRAGGYEGAQDYDLLLRCSEKTSRQQIHHIPYLLYHWRAVEGSTAKATDEKDYASDAGLSALRDHLSRQLPGATVEAGPYPTTYRVHYPIPQPAPKVSLIIPTRNGHAILKNGIDSILQKTTYSNFEILILNNQSDEQQTIDYLAEIDDGDQVRVIDYNHPFNYSAINNFAAEQARGEILGLVNNDIEVISPGWLDEMVVHVVREEVGVVGAKLYYPDEKLQHGGVILGIGGVAGHSHKHYPREHPGYFSRLALPQEMSAVTAACCLVRRTVFEEMGGLDAEHFKVAFNDVDFCLRVREAGYRNIWTPYAELYHHESISRGYEDTPEKQARFRAEVTAMKKRWGHLLACDPCYNPNLTLEDEQFNLANPPRYTPRHTSG